MSAGESMPFEHTESQNITLEKLMSSAWVLIAVLNGEQTAGAAADSLAPAPGAGSIIAGVGALFDG